MARRLQRSGIFYVLCSGVITDARAKKNRKGQSPAAASDVLIRCLSSPSPLQTGIQGVARDARSVFFWPCVRGDRDEAQRWSAASSAFAVTSEGITGVQTSLFFPLALCWLDQPNTTAYVQNGSCEDDQKIFCFVFINQTYFYTPAYTAVIASIFELISIGKVLFIFYFLPNITKITTAAWEVAAYLFKTDDLAIATHYSFYSDRQVAHGNVTARRKTWSRTYLCIVPLSGFKEVCSFRKSPCRQFKRCHPRQGEPVSGQQHDGEEGQAFWPPSLGLICAFPSPALIAEVN